MSRRKWTDDQLIDAVKTNYSMRSVIKTLGLSPTRANYKNFYIQIERLGLNTDHFTGQGWLKGRRHNNNKTIPDEEVFSENSTYLSTKGIKNKLLKTKNFKAECQMCGLTKWLDQPLSLRLDHINGNNRDNRIDNLRLLCPNCDSQTEFYCGRNIGRYKSYQSEKEKKETLVKFRKR